MVYNENKKILFKKSPPVAWSGFWGIIYINELHSESRKYDEGIDNVEFTYSGVRDYNSLIKFLNMS